MFSTVTVDSRIDKSAPIYTQSGLAAILPADVAERIAPELLAEPYTAPSLRILATVKDERIWEHVGSYRIDWLGMQQIQGLSPSVRLRVEIAAGLAGWQLGQLDAGNFAAVADALRIAYEGLAS